MRAVADEGGGLVGKSLSFFSYFFFFARFGVVWW